MFSSSPYLTVGYASNVTPYINMSSPSAGMMRYNGSNNCTEVYDGSNWLRLETNPVQDLSLSSEAADIMAWASKKMAEETKLKALAAKFPALQKAMDNLDLIKALVENENLETTV